MNDPDQFEGGEYEDEEEDEIDQSPEEEEVKDEIAHVEPETSEND